MPAGVERICVVIGRTRHKMIQAEVAEAARRGATMIEVRLDFLAKAPDFKRLLANKPCAMVATVRRQHDGGRWSGTEAQRQILLRQAIVAGFDYVDIETDIANAIGRFKNVKRIISYHNLREVPADLERIHQRMCGQDADVVKIAVSAQNPSDNLRVLDLLKNPPVPTVAFCMGDMGFPSRILAAKYGAPFAYAAFNKERTIALGIPSFEEMKNVYHYHRLDADSQVYGVLGDPVGHSLSPLIHNVALQKLGLNGVYLPFRVPRGELKSFLQNYDRFPIRGYSVTIPHKEAAQATARYPSTASTEVEAANTLVRGVDGFSAYNTDYQAARDSLRANLLPDNADGTSPMVGLNVLVLGAGGIGRAIVHMLHRDGARVTVSNRSLDRAHQLAIAVGCRFTSWETRHSIPCDLLVNCTSVGMSPNVDETPINANYFTPDIMVFDTIYTPETTLLIKDARSRGCRVLTGVDMFVRQAELQFRLFTEREPPPGLMYRLVKRALSPVALEEEESP
jgi:3-dehydroquinate dehydratase/shikimate dehydrogenase